MIITISKFHQSTYSNTDEDKWTDLKLCLFYSRKDTCDLTGGIKGSQLHRKDARWLNTDVESE